MTRIIAFLALAIALNGQSLAHELRPGFLEVQQKGAETFDIRFKVPARGELRLGLYVRLPSGCEHLREPVTERTSGAFLERFLVRCQNGLKDQEIIVDGLASTFTDVVARVGLSDGSTQAGRLTPDRPYLKITGHPTWISTARTYLWLGVEHILLGIDHLLFVLGLLLLIRVPWMLVKTITAFTVAHSVTLAAASLHWIQVPQAPVEAVIALSIIFVAAEAVRAYEHEDSLANRAPWIIALAFGLLHGFGFGGALNEIGLPQSDVPLALLSFNLGVEAGQLVFVFAVLTLKSSLVRLSSLEWPWLRNVLGYGIGSLAGFWFIQRVVAIV